MQKIIYILAILPVVFTYHEPDDYKTHVCIRDCAKSNNPMVCKYNFTVEWFQILSKACYDCPNNITDCGRVHCIAGDGYKRAIVTVNRLLPGPLIQVCQNDIIDVIVHDNLRMGESTSIHWHGILQKETPYMDGVGMVTQCPIHHHTFFEYKFKAADAGTHFWHAHVGVQRGDGVFGGLIVKEKNDINAKEYDFDLNEHVIILNDWYNETIVSKFSYFVHSTTESNRPTSILINGKGHNLNKNRTEKQTPSAVFTVKKGYKYRFRLISAGFGDCPLQFSIDNHKLLVIASDGNSIEPTEFEAIVLYAGERYDIVVNANQKIDNYFIKIKGLADCEDYKVFQTAILNYETISLNNEELINDLDYDSIKINGRQLNSIKVPLGEKRENYIDVNELKSKNTKENQEYLNSLKGKPNKKFYFGTQIMKIDNPQYFHAKHYPIDLMPESYQYYTPQINMISLEMPNIPILTQYNDLDKSLICNEKNIENICPNRTVNHCSCLHMIKVNLNDLVEFIFVDESLTARDIDFEAIHPIHLHGYKYAVISMDVPDIKEPLTTAIVKELDKNNKIKRNFDNPILKDTVKIPGGGYTIMRWKANNPGIWLLHCHLEFHLEAAGMGFLVQVGHSHEFKKQPKNFPKCGPFLFETEKKKKEIS